MAKQAKSPANYFVVPAPSTYGEVTNVLWNGKKLDAVKEMAPRGYVVRLGPKKAGDRWYPREEADHPEVWRRESKIHHATKGRQRVHHVTVADEWDVVFDALEDGDAKRAAEIVRNIRKEHGVTAVESLIAANALRVDERISAKVWNAFLKAIKPRSARLGLIG